MTDDRIDYHRNRLRGVPLADLDRMLGEVLRDVAREAAEVERARVLQAGVPGRWADIVEQRLLTWRQRFTNRSGDQLALDDFMDQQSIDDLVDFVCDEHAAPQPPSASPFPISYDRPTDVLTINGKRYAACLFDARGLLAPAGTVFRIEDGPDDTVTLTRLQQPPSAQADAVEALRGVASEHDIGYAAGWRSCADEAARIVASHIDRLEPGKHRRMRDALLDLLASMRSILVSQRHNPITDEMNSALRYARTVLAAQGADR